MSEIETTQSDSVPSWRGLVQINVNYLGITAIAQTLTPLIIPLLIQQFIGVTRQATFYGNLRLWTLMVAVLAQSLAGILSDRSTISWGKRRPFILLGTMLVILLLIGIGVTAGFEGEIGYWILFGLMILLMISINIAQAAQQGLIPDLVPDKFRGKASGIKALFEIPLPLIIVAFTIAPLVGRGQIWPAIAVLIGIITLCLVITMTIKERRPQSVVVPVNWVPFVRLVIMTVVFSLIIVIIGSVINILVTFLAGKVERAGAIIILGCTGVLGMVFATGLGVYFSTLIGLGQAEAHQNPKFTWWIINRLAFLVGSVNLASFAVFFLQGRLGFEQKSAAGPASFLLLVVGLAILVVVLPAGFLSDRFGHNRMIVISGLFAIAGVVLLLVTNNLFIIYVGALIIGMATGLFYTSNWALGTEIVPKYQAGKYLGIANLAGAGAGAIGAFIGGPIADFFTRNFPELPGSGYVLLFGMYGCMFVLSILVTKKLS